MTKIMDIILGKNTTPMAGDGIKVEDDKEDMEIGRKLSKECEWDGAKILRVASYALTDANFHEEAKVVFEMTGDMYGGGTKIKNTPIGTVLDGYKLVKRTKDAAEAKKYATQLIDEGKYATHDFRDAKSDPELIDVWMMLKEK